MASHNARRLPDCIIDALKRVEEVVVGLTAVCGSEVRG